MVSQFQTKSRSRYRRRRRRNSHYGVLLVIVLVIVAAISIGVRFIAGISSSGISTKEVVFQLENPRALAGGELVDIGGTAPTMDASGNAMIPVDALESTLGLAVEKEQISNSMSIEHKKTRIRMQVGNASAFVNDKEQTIGAVPVLVNNIMYIPVKELTELLGWDMRLSDLESGSFIVVSKAKKEISDSVFQKACKSAYSNLGPSREQAIHGSIIMRVDADKFLNSGADVQMKQDDGKKSVSRVINQNGVYYIPLQNAVSALGGTASVDEKGNWTIQCNDIDSKISSKGKVKAGKTSLKEHDAAFYMDSDNQRVYVSTTVFAAIVGKHYSDLGEGLFAFTNMSMEGFDSQKVYLLSLTSDLTQSKTGDIPEADVYIALTFDDGPTGRMEEYSSGLTSYLLDGLKERGAHVTFFMCGYRVEDFNGHMSRLLAEGHELGNHTMSHPDSTLVSLSYDDVKKQMTDADALIEEHSGQKSTAMRPVGGAYDDTVKEVMKELGLPIINWDIDTFDWKKRDKESVRDIIVNEARDGSIVLMHDLYPTSVEGALEAIDVLQAKTDKTYAFVTVEELAEIKGITLEPGVVYTNLNDAIDLSANKGNNDAAEDAA